MNPLSLRQHPRLCISEANIASLAHKAQLPFLQQAQDVVTSAANKSLKEPLTYPHTHNALLERARRAQTRMLNFLVRWQQTQQLKYKIAILSLVQDMHDWEFWSWISWREGKSAPDALFDLSYGENSTTLAIAYDWLYHELNKAERQLFIDTAEKWSFASGLKHAHASGAWWFAAENSNWNTVCAGGLGMLALAMYEDSAAARKILPHCELSVKPFIQYLNKTNGAWPEGTGYWNYGMRYAFLYLLSYENATQKKHPLLRIRGVKQTLAFPMDFNPNGTPCSFGDVNSWGPMPFHYRVADVLGCDEILSQLDSLDKSLSVAETWPRSALWLLFHKGSKSTAKTIPVIKPYAKIYKGLDWALLGDQSSHSKLYMSIRGGTTKVPHGQRDLLSFHCVVGDEALITHPQGHEYLDTTFSNRREELFEIGPQSKNTLFINGVGIVAGSALDSTSLVHEQQFHGVRLIATSAMGEMRDAPAAAFCGRLIIMLDSIGYLIIDRFDLTQLGRVESRINTYAHAQCQKSTAVLIGKRQQLRLSYASNVESVLVTASTAPTKPTATPMQQLRWCSKDLHRSITFATLISPGRGKNSVSVIEAEAQIKIQAQIGTRDFSINCSKALVLR